MLFNKQDLSLKVDEKIRDLAHKHNPDIKDKKTIPDTDYSPYDLHFLNFVKYFDQKTPEMKNLLFATRKAIADKCFKEEENKAYPNLDKVEYCKKTHEAQYLNLLKFRETNFANVEKNFNEEYENCSTFDNDCRKRVLEKRVWNESRLPYYFAEKNLI